MSVPGKPEDPGRTLSLGPVPQETMTLGPAAGGPAWSPGAVIDDLYEIRTVLGEGGFGTVHKVYHRAWKMELAVKSPRADRVSDRRALELFVQEANTWVGLGLHPHITACYFVRVLGLPRIFVEYMEGGSLSDWLRLGKVRDLRSVLDMAVQLARAMEYAHGRGLVHRDLKPGNCLMTPGGTLKVTDFGLAKVGGAEEAPDAAPEPPKGAKIARVREATMTGRLGTPEYMAPEQWYQAGKVTRAADIWAFGVILHELAAGGRPFEMADGEPPDAFYVRMLEGGWRYEPPQGMPEGLARVIVSCLAPDPAQRPPDLRALRESLEESYARLGEGPYPREAGRDTPLSADVLNNQGVSMADLGRGEEASRLFTAALRADPTHPGAAYNEGVLLLGAGRLDAAGLIARLAQSAQARPRDWTPLYLKGMVQLSGKAVPAALADLDAALALAPGNPLAAAARQRAGSGAGAERIDFFVSPPQGAESARMVDSAFQSLLARARQELETGQWEKAYATVSKARGVKGHDRSPQALDLTEALGLRGVRQKLKAGWHTQLFAGSESATCTCVSSDGKLVLSGHADRTVRLWELDAGRLLWSREGDARDVRAVALPAGGRTALSAGGEGTLKVWDLDSGGLLKTIPGHAGPVNALSVSSDGRYALSASDDKTLWLWDLSKGGRVRSLTAHASPVAAACLSHDCLWAVSGGGDGSLRSWDLAKAELQREFPAHAGAVRALAFSADGRWLVSAGDDAELRFWERAAAQPRRLPGHQGAVRGVCFTPEGRFVLSAGDDGRLIVWDAGTGERVWTFEGQARGLSSVCASPDARYAVTAGQDGVRVWELDWEFSFPEPADWHEGARPHLEAFLSRRSLTLPPGQSPSWSDADIDGLLTDLSRKGFGWVKPEAVRRELRSLSGLRAGERAAPGRRFWLALAVAVLAAAAVFAWLLWGRKAADQEAFAQRESPADRISPAQPAPPPAARPAPAQPQAPAAPPDDMALIPAGEFLMGSPEGEGHPTEQPAHRVHVSAFRIDRTPVTAAQYRRFSEARGWPMRQQPFYSEDDHPVVFVDWHDAQAYCAWRGKRLPTEAEFEKAARGGTDTAFSFGNSPSGLPAHSWFRGNSEEQTHPVGTKAPNPYGLHDMSGNVMHWVADWFDPVYYRRSPARDPRGPAEGQFRTVRGCAWHDEPATCRAAMRARTKPDSPVNGRGFRCAKP